MVDAAIPVECLGRVESATGNVSALGDWLGVVLVGLMIMRRRAMCTFGDRRAPHHTGCCGHRVMRRGRGTSGIGGKDDLRAIGGLRAEFGWGSCWCCRSPIVGRAITLTLFDGIEKHQKLNPRNLKKANTEGTSGDSGLGATSGGHRPQTRRLSGLLAKVHPRKRAEPPPITC